MLPVSIGLHWFLVRLLRRAWARNDSYNGMVRQLILELDAATPYILIGRTRRASYDADNARRKASRAKKRETGE